MTRPPPTPMLQAFVASAETGSFVKASAQLNLTASAISHQIKNLERGWGLILFERHSRGVTLTAAGERLLPIVAAFFGDLDTTLESLTESKPSPIDLVCTSSLCQNWLGPRLVRQAHDFDIALRMKEVTVGNIGNESFDVAIAICENAPEGYESRILMSDTVFPVCAPSFLQERNADFLSNEELMSLPIIERAQDGICPSWDDWWRFVGQDSPPHAQGPKFPDTSMTLRLAASGQGIALGRMALVFGELCNGTLAPATEHAMSAPAPYRLIWRRDNTSPQIAALSNWLLDEAEAFISSTANQFPALAAKMVADENRLTPDFSI